MMTITSSSSCFGFFFCPLQFISQFLSMLDKLIFNERQNIPLTCMRHIYYSFKTRQSIRQLKIQTTSKIFKQKQTCYAIARIVNKRNHFFGFGKTQTQTKKFHWNPNRNPNRNPVLKYKNNFWNKNSIALFLLDYGTKKLINNNFLQTINNFRLLFAKNGSNHLEYFGKKA